MFETRHGLLAHYDEDELLGRCLRQYGEWAEEEVFLMSGFLHTGDTALDIGANVGSHAVAFGRMVGEGGQVLAVDGQRRVSGLLALNLLLNGGANVTRIEGLVGREDAVVHLASRAEAAVPNLGAISFRDTVGGAVRPAKPEGPHLPIALFSIDGLELASCHLIKIDVEGMELDVLLGATLTLDRHKPYVYFEQTSAINFPEIVGLLRDHGYDLYWHTANPYNRHNFRGDPQNIFGGTCEVNVLAVHRERPFARPSGIDLVPVAGDHYDPPPSATGLAGWTLPPDAYRVLPPTCQRSAVAMPPAPDHVTRSVHDALQARFSDLEADRAHAQEIMVFQADLIAACRTARRPPEVF